MSSNGFYNVTVKNGLVEGFFYSIGLDSCDNCTVDEISIKNSVFRGIAIFGDKSTVINNKIDDIRGTGGAYASSYTFGIEVSGPNSTVKNNDIREIWAYREGEGVGIAFALTSEGSHIEDNTLVWGQNPGFGRTLGIWTAAEVDPETLRNNLIVGSDYAGAGKVPKSIESNIFQTNCGIWLGRIAKIDETNTSRPSSFRCSSEPEVIEKMLVKQPDDPILNFRYDMALLAVSDIVVKERHEEAHNFIDRSCDLEFSEACRYIKRQKETGSYYGSR